MSEAAWRREVEGDLVLLLHVQPGAKRTEVAGIHGETATGRLRIRLAAPPVDGKANAELVRFLAAAFGVPRRAVTLLARRDVAAEDRTDRASAAASGSGVDRRLEGL